MNVQMIKKLASLRGQVLLLFLFHRLILGFFVDSLGYRQAQMDRRRNVFLSSAGKDFPKAVRGLWSAEGAT